MLPKETTRRHLILSAVTGYDAATLAPFVRSWRTNVPATDLVMLAGQLAPQTVSWLTSEGVQIVPASLQLVSHRSGVRKAIEYKLLDGSSLLFGVLLQRVLRLADQRATSVRQALLGIQSARWCEYDHFLTLHGWRYDQILFADARDTVFQRSPFPTSGFHVFSERERIGESHFARRWFQLTYGGSEWRSLRARGFLCSGISLGEVRLAREYLGLMHKECVRVLAVNAEDQAVHNFIVHSGLIPATCNEFGDGDAINLNGARLDELCIEDGLLLDRQHRPYAVVHQYDRVDGLEEQLRICRL